MPPIDHGRLSIDIVSGPVRRNRSTMRILSLCGVFRVIVVRGEKPDRLDDERVAAPTARLAPLNVGSESVGSGRPSV